MYEHFSRKRVMPYKHRCGRCVSTGRLPCEICNGRGEVSVGSDAYGNLKYARCSGCFGLKIMRCKNCGGVGYV